jgi:hypothetical protein
MNGARNSGMNGFTTGRLPMTTGRRVALILGVPFALLLIGWAGVTEVAFAAQGSQPLRLSLPARARALDLSANVGDLNVRQTTGTSLRLIGNSTYWLVQPSVTWRSTPSRVLVTAHCRFALGPCSFDYRAVLPAGTGLSLSDGTGDITVSGLTALHVNATDNQGDITLAFTKVPDHVRVVDQLGDVTLVLPQGSIAYKISALVSLGSASISVPRSPSSTHVISVIVQNGDITIRN